MSKKYKKGHQRKSIKAILGILFLLVIMAITIKVNQHPTSQNIHAAPASILSFSSSSLQATVGTPLSADISVDPGSNSVSLINLVIGYDSSKLTPAQNGFVPNTTAFPKTLDGPTYNICTGTQCTMSIVISISNDPTQAIKTLTKVATVNFQAVSPGTTSLTFDQATHIFSVGAQDSSDSNVLLRADPAAVTITGSGAISPTPISSSPTPTQSISQTPSATPISPAGPTNTPQSPGQPTSTPAPADAIGNFSLTFAGIGLDGNAHPLHPLRPVTIALYNTTANTTTTFKNNVVYNGKYFTNSHVDFGTLPTGDYQIFVKADKYLNTRLVQNDGTFTIHIDQGTTVTIPANTLIAGDAAPINSDGSIGNNVLDILDYNQIISCYGIRATQPTCANKEAGDLDDNGIIDGIDYNIFLRGLAVAHVGDVIP